jgi:hypothetical protein
MSRNRVKSRLEKKTLKTQINVPIAEKNIPIINNLQLNDDLEYNDIIDLVNSNALCQEIDFHEIPSDSHTNQAIIALKNITYMMQKNNSLKEKQDKFNVNAIDPTLDFRFLNRKSNENIFLPPIRTKLSWQNGEFPFFKIDVRYYNQQTTTYKNQRRKQRRIKTLAMQNMATGHYYDMEYPTQIWPCKGIIYITNLRLFFKRTKDTSFYISFDNILSYCFYGNAIVVEHLQHEQKMVDVFYVDSEQARLLETIIQITL